MKASESDTVVRDLQVDLSVSDFEGPRYHFYDMSFAGSSFHPTSPTAGIENHCWT